MNSTVHPPLTASRPGTGLPLAWWPSGLGAALAWAALGALTLAWPNKPAGFSDWTYTTELGWFSLVLAGVLALLGVGGRRAAPLLRHLRPLGPWLTALGLGLAAWELVTAKLGWLPTPFFAPPQSLAGMVVAVVVFCFGVAFVAGILVVVATV